MTRKPDILCIGSVLWDVIGRRPDAMEKGDDRPGQITRVPGGVALNVAMALRRAGLTPALLSCVGQDVEGDSLLDTCADLGLDAGYLYRSKSLRTDMYMAIEAAGDLVAAMADARSLEQAGAAILKPLADGRLGSVDDPYPGTIVLDGNLTQELLTKIAESPLFRRADLRVAPASPGKAERLRPILLHPSLTLYVNLQEASLLCNTAFDSATDAAQALGKMGARRAIVTNGDQSLAQICENGLVEATPPPVNVTRITGAGDTFMAGHVAAELRGLTRQEALTFALDVTATYISESAIQ
ncbi:PfkB family carbohydrate kinase [Actibacterium sp. 188UL27-1]|uniref:PfkB family carbohydrate kinase n=1 Tax=Actibacterium sp. 188UL27-1 TaxID=2786961 RepID=UPI00195809C8|nr:PfkB family carbohydrate kinase [Actibacterium sp. 188UL27-1]MBM7067853.1 kinase [Actibacterium sp. 188UL27-1]